MVLSKRAGNTQIKNGLTFFILGVPIDRLTVAPAPSDCSRASSICLIARGFGDAAFRDGSSGAMGGKPTNPCCAAIVDLKFFVILLRVFALKKGRIYPNKVSCW